MRNQDQYPGVILQELFKNIQGVDVQVIGRLIEDQEVGVCHQHAHQLKTLLFTTAQLVHKSKLLLRREKEFGQQLGSRDDLAVLHFDIVSNILDDIQYALVGLELQTFLAIVPIFGCFTNVDLACSGLDISSDQVQEGGLPATVLTGQTYAVAFLERIGERGEDGLSGNRKSSAFQLQYFVALSCNLHTQFYLVLLAWTLGFLLQVIEGFDTSLRFRTACLRLPAHPFKFLAPQVSGLIRCKDFIRLPLCFLLQEEGVVTLIGIDLALIELTDFRTDIVQKIAVVRYQENGLTSRCQELFQPFNRFDIQVVGRLIQDIDIRLIDQELGQSQSLLLSTAQ